MIGFSANAFSTAAFSVGSFALDVLQALIKRFPGLGGRVGRLMRV